MKSNTAVVHSYHSFKNDFISITATNYKEMAEGVLSNIAAKILEVLGSQVFQEITLAAGVKDEIRKLKDTVSTIKAVILDAEEQHNKKNRQVIEWLQRLKDAFYDADDLLDDFSTELKQREEMTANKIAKEVRLFFSKSNQIAYSLKMANEIKTVRERLDNIAEDRKFHLDEGRVQITNRETHSFIPSEKVIGRDNDKNKIVQLLLDSSNDDVKNVSVISIVGIGGLGKTTLAQLVYNDEEVMNHFQLRMWVCLYDNFDVKIIIEKIIKSATNIAPTNLDIDQLQTILRREINGKKYLLVLDDSWNEDHVKWGQLEDLLMNGARGSKIIITTRSAKVVEATRTQIPSHTLKGLLDDQSWNLFSKMAFKQGVEPTDTRLVAIGKEIVAKCLGVPLTLKTIGSFLYSKNTIDGWLQFKDNEMSKIGQNNDILDILKLSYNHLSSNLKQCFAYCALFPKDHCIVKQKLIYSWMAQGFLESSNKNECLEHIGLEYFNILLSRSFFQEAKYDDWGNITNCKMHDLMHDLAQSVAGSECTLAALDGENFNESARYVSFQNCDYHNYVSWKIPPVLFGANHIRAISFPFFSFIRAERKLNEYEFKTMLSSFKSLRMLNLSNSRVEKLPRSIGELKHLRYLDLSENIALKKLPSSISKLLNLETLDLFGCGLEELPRDIRKMVSLRSLIIEECFNLTNMPCGLGLLTDLQTLPLFKVGRRDRSTPQENLQLSELQSLNNLRGKLEIRYLEHMENAATPSLAILKEKKYLRSLTLWWEIGEPNVANDSRQVRIDEKLLEGLTPHPNLENFTMFYFQGVELSHWLSSLTNLTSITLVACNRCRHIPPFDGLPSLKKLYLEELDALEYISETGSNYFSSTLSMSFFQSLGELMLRNCPKLKGWWRDDNGATTQMTELPAFPCLSNLEITNCPNLTSMPLYPSLEELDLRKTSSKPLQQTMMLMNHAAPSTSSSNSASLFKLKSLYISRVEDLESLPEEGSRYLTSLVDMNILFCPRLSQLSQFIGYLTSLKKMNIVDCTNLLMDDDDMQWQSLGSLHSLRFSHLPKLVSLPMGLQYVTTLESLHIEFCPNLMELPEWICNFRSLTKVKIYDCPRLLEGWRNSMGAFLPNISHIPEIFIDGCRYQWNSYQGSSSLTVV